jgi:hypothetical protein
MLRRRFYQWFGLGLLSLALFLVPHSLQAAAKPKFFICPHGTTRDATLLTETYAVNFCSIDTAVLGNSGTGAVDQNRAEISIAAMRNRRTKQQMNLPVTTTDDIVYIAKGKRNTYRFDFNRRTLTIQPLQGKGRATVEKILSSD